MQKEGKYKQFSNWKTNRTSGKPKEDKSEEQNLKKKIKTEPKLIQSQMKHKRKIELWSWRRYQQEGRRNEQIDQQIQIE